MRVVKIIVLGVAMVASGASANVLNDHLYFHPEIWGKCVPDGKVDCSEAMQSAAEAAAASEYPSTVSLGVGAYLIPPSLMFTTNYPDSPEAGNDETIHCCE